MSDSPYIAWPGDADGRDQLGGKAAALNALAETDLPIPAWFVLTPRAFADSVPECGEPGAPSPAVRRALEDALGRLHGLAAAGHAYFAVRSSAPGEDAATASFAGQLESALGVAPADVPAHVADVWRSAFAEPARAYRRVQGLAEQRCEAPAVLVQRMVPARCAGVAFSTDPATGAQDTAVVSAVWGLGTRLVDGDESGDTYRVDRSGSVTDRAATLQREACQLGGKGLRTVPLGGEDGLRPVLTDAEAGRVAALARQAERHFGAPQDIEWALDEDRQLFLLQSRPITTLGSGGTSPSVKHAASTAPRSSSQRLWDNSNIAESYGGVTTPLTFSFARRAYRAVYRTFCRALGVPGRTVEAHAGAFRSMIGLVRGRLYYNLQSWYEVLRLLPGFRFNRAFMEDMMGVSEQLPEAFLSEPPPASLGEKVSDAWHLVRSAFKMTQAHGRIDERAEAFQEHVDRTLSTSPVTGEQGLDALVDRYVHLEETLLGQWDVPIVNDFLTMVFFGLSRRLLAAWGPGEQLHGALLTGAQNIVSAEPARRIDEMAALGAGDAALVEQLTEGPRTEIEAALRTRPAFRRCYEAYLDRFGDRCLGELKLESQTLREDPMPLLRAVGNRARNGIRRGPPSAASTPAKRRERAEAELAAALRGRPVRQRVLRWSLRHARARIAMRENLRFERTRVFGTARVLFLDMGRCLADAGRLQDARDVFYLEVEELLDFARGTATTTDLAGLAAVRKEEFARYRDAPAPPDRLVTRGAVHLHLSVALDASPGEATPGEAAPAATPPGDRLRTGQGCGGSAEGHVARGPACVVEDPRAATLTGKEILVARQTDPGWTPLFASCAGVVVERGNLLSHAAVVAREMGLPAVVGVEDATRWLSDAGRIEVNGRTGTVRVLSNTRNDHTNERPTAEETV